MAERLAEIDAKTKALADLRLLGNTAGILNSLWGAQALVKRLKELERESPRTVEAPSGFRYTVRPNDVSGAIQVGNYWPRGMGDGEAVLAINGAQTAPFIGNLLVTTGDVFLVIEKTDSSDEFDDRGCVVPNPPHLYLNLEPID